MSDHPHRRGSRRAPKAARRSLPSPPRGTAVSALATVVAAALLVLLSPSEPGVRSAPPTVATGSVVRDTTLGCPGLPEVPEGLRTSYGTGLAPVEDLVPSDEGRVTTTPGDVLSLPRGATSVAGGETSQGLIVRGEGAAAPGLFAWRADTGPALAVSDCPSPRASWWFVGAGAALAHQSTLVLANLDTGPATVDLRILSPSGEVDLSETGGLGISVAAGGRVSLPLADLVPENDELSLWVHATRGRVVAALSDRYAPNPTDAGGLAWTPAQTVPARVVRLAGVPLRAKSRTLLVANPSPLEAVVTIEVAGRSGRFVPADVDALSIAPGGVQAVDLSAVLRGQPYAVRLRAERPIVAAMRSVLRGGDVTYSGVALPLTGPAAFPAIGKTMVQVTAGRATARAELTAYSESGQVVGQTRLAMAQHAIGTWKVPAKAAYVVAVPVQGRVFGAVLYDASAAVPLRDLPISLRIPWVRPAG